MRKQSLDLAKIGNREKYGLRLVDRFEIWLQRFQDACKISFQYDDVNKQSSIVAKFYNNKSCRKTSYRTVNLGPRVETHT